MLFAIDIGNTRIKIGVFFNHKLHHTIVTNQKEFTTEIDKFCKGQQNRVYILSSVANISNKNIDFLANTGQLYIINHASPIPFVNQYATPHTLGIDRIVLTAGAALSYPNQNNLIIDMGTCITYDFVSSTRQYKGGAISPGATLRFKSMNDYTSNLPLLEIEEIDDFVGNSTKNSMLSGVINGIAHEIDTFIEKYQNKYGNINVILTGGDALFFEKRLKSCIFAKPNFLLESLYLHYQYINNK